MDVGIESTELGNNENPGIAAGISSLCSAENTVQLIEDNLLRRMY